MSSTTATVETLTAEVRVLMVGNRQVTLSVARQLDWCKLQDMEPFGRIRIGDSDDTVIGRHRTSGALVNAKYRIHPSRLYIDEGDVLGKVTVCRAVTPISPDDDYDLSYGSRQIRVARSIVQACAYEDHSRWRAGEKCGHWLSNGHDAEIKVAIDRADQLFELHRRAARLPLIVLAGLR